MSGCRRDGAGDFTNELKTSIRRLSDGQTEGIERIEPPVEAEAALAAAQDAGSISEAERLSRHLTTGANEPAAPASFSK
jgi:hypothetical protein